jgi:two-component system, LytTR family, sensor kinase
LQNKIYKRCRWQYFGSILTIKFIRMKKYIVVLLHLGYWFMYSFMVLVILEAFYRGKTPSLNEAIYSPAVLINILLAFLPALIGFYFFYTILFEKFLSKEKFLSFLLAVLLISEIAPIIAEISAYAIFNGVLKNVQNIRFLNPALSLVTLVSGTIGLVMKGFIRWYGDIKIKVELNKKNYETELALMKAQINPHFLFNTINNIDVLIQKDPSKASEYLNKLSDIMRFMLYETKSEKITLVKELSYIEKYIELQKIRTTNVNYVKYEVKGNAGNLLIEPMLFIPFIENAFKHSENKRIENAIKICFVIEKDKIKFECENAYVEDKQLKLEHSGLGNELIDRRLVLLYPGRHTFEVINKDGIYNVNVLISL